MLPMRGSGNGAVIGGRRRGVKALAPLVAPHRQEGVRVERVRLRHLDVEFADAETGAGRDVVVAVLRPRRMLQEIEAPGLAELAEQFLHDEVGGAGVQLERGRGRDRPERVVVRDRDVAGVRDRRDLLRLQDAADVHDVGLQHADLALPQQRRQMMLGVATLARREAGADAAADLGQRLDVLGVARLLEPVKAIRLELLGDRDRGRRAEPAVTVDQDLHLGADRVAHRRDPLDRLADQRVVRVAARALERVELEAAIAFVPHRVRRIADLGGGRAGAVPRVGVRGQALAHAAAEQLVHRPLQRLADDVPHGDLERADRAVQDRPAARELVAEHRLPQALDRERGLADDVALGELMDRRLDRLRLPFAGTLAHTGDAVVGEHPGEHPVAPAGADQMGLDPRNPAVAAARGHDRLPQLRCIAWRRRFGHGIRHTSSLAPSAVSGRGRAKRPNAASVPGAPAGPCPTAPSIA